MRTKLIHQSSDGQRTYVVVLETGEEVAARSRVSPIARSWKRPN